MTTYHPNTLKLIHIEDKALCLGWYKKYPRTCFCEEVAKRSGELGNDYPSDTAIEVALEMLKELEEKATP